MQRLNAHEKRTIIFAALFVLIASLLRYFSMRGVFPILFGWLRGIVQCGLLVTWGLSIRRRVLPGKIRNYLLAIATLLVFWIAERTVKYMLADSLITVKRYLWYMYYIPMVLVPLFALFSAFCLGRKENFVLPKRYRLLYIPAGLMILIVLTNDFHQQVFRFPNGVLNGGDDYSYGFFYSVVLSFIGIEVLLFFIGLFKKSRLPDKGRRLFIPFIPVLIGILYATVYILDREFLHPFAGDMNAVFSTLIVLTCECCINLRLIPSNNRYGELFSASSLSARITDENNHVFLASDSDIEITEEEMRRAKKAPVMISDSLRLLEAPITGGYVFWTEDISALTDVLKKLTSSKELLENSNMLLEKNYRTMQNTRQLEEKNRLYDAMALQTSSQIDQSCELLEKFRQTEDEEEKRRLLGRLVVIGAYLKRRNNLFFISEQTKRIPERELELCLEESFDNLRLCGIDGNYYINIGGDLSAETATALYDFFEQVTETAFEKLYSMLLRIFKKADSYYCCINLECDADLSVLAGEQITWTHDEDRTEELILRIPKGGGGK